MFSSVQDLPLYGSFNQIWIHEKARFGDLPSKGEGSTIQGWRSACNDGADLATHLGGLSFIHFISTATCHSLLVYPRISEKDQTIGTSLSDSLIN